VKIALLVFTGVLVVFLVAGYIVGNAATSGIFTILKSDYIDKSNNTLYPTAHNLIIPRQLTRHALLMMMLWRSTQ